MIYLIFSVVFFLFGLLFFGIGLKVILSKRPLIVSSKLLRSVALIAITPILLRPMIAAHAVTIFPALMWLLLLGVIWKQSNGYSIFGIANPAFRDSLIATLKNLDIHFEEDMTGIKVPSENIHLEAMAMSSGLSRIRIKEKTHAEWLKKLATALGQYYKSTPVEITRSFSIFYLVFGILMVGFVLCAFLPHLLNN